MRSGSRLAASLMIAALILSGCRTIQDVAYVKGSDAANAGRYEEAFEQFKSVAAVDGYDGQASAQYRLGDMYLEGQGTKSDPAQALRMFELCAASTDRQWRKMALFKLGVLYDQGLPGVMGRDRLKAAGYFRKAADEGYAPAASYLKSLERYPELFVSLHPEEFAHATPGMAPAGMSAAFDAFERGDTQRALTIFLWHARNGNELAQASVAQFYKDGLVVAKNPANYAGWTWLSARNGNPRAQMEMGQLYRTGKIVPGSDVEALQWFSAASAQGMAEATNWMGIIAANPIDTGVEPDWGKAVGYFRQAIDGGSTFGLVNLGDAMFAGKGTVRDTDGARRLYQQAADAGNVVARRKLTEMGVASAAKSQLPSVATPKPPVLSPVEIYAKLSPSVFRLIAADIKDDGAASGSAVALTSSLAISNCHVIDGYDVIGAKMGGDVALFRIAGKSPEKDMCVVKADLPLVPATTFRRYSDVKVGEKVYAIGSPKALENTLSEGIVSGLRTSDGVRYIQTTAPIAQGSSGGGLFDEYGRLIGITTWMVKGEGNLNFAVAVDEALEVLDRSK